MQKDQKTTSPHGCVWLGMAPSTEAYLSSMPLHVRSSGVPSELTVGCLAAWLPGLLATTLCFL